MIDKKTWKDFQDSGLLWWINMILHTFGWAIVLCFEENGTVSDAYPARVKFRGFDDKSNEEGYRKVSRYIAGNADALNHEAQS